MSADAPLFETAIIISPDDRVQIGERQELPLHLNVVDPFIASHMQTNRLMKSIAGPLFRNVFEIAGFEHKDRGNERLQRLGGSVLHSLHDEIIDAMDRLDIAHDNKAWIEGSIDTWYSGTWHVPGHRTKIDQVYVAQEMSDGRGWQVLRTYDLHVPSDDFRQDPMYIDSVINPARGRRAG